MTAVAQGCDRFYCQAPADPAVADVRCILHSEDPNKPAAPIAAAIVGIRNSGQASCRGWIFPERVNLREMALTLADFRDAVFMQGADFERSRFYGATEFGKADFRGPAIFTSADFADPPLLGKISFNETLFQGQASFFLAKFDEVDFRFSRFDDVAIFDRVSARRLTFTSTEFRGLARFREMSASDGISFVQARMLARAEFNLTDMSRVSFSFCEARMISLSGAARVAAAEFHGMLWPRNGIAEEQEARGAKELQRYRSAERVYREIRRGAEDRRQYADADWAYRRELEMRRLSYAVRNPGWWGRIRASIGSLEALYRALSDYGSSLWRPLIGLGLSVFVVFPYASAWQGLTVAGTTYGLTLMTDPADALASYWTIVVVGLRIAALLPEPSNVALSTGAAAVAVLLRLAGPFFAFLFSLAVRRQLRR